MRRMVIGSLFWYGGYCSKPYEDLLEHVEPVSEPLGHDRLNQCAVSLIGLDPKPEGGAAEALGGCIWHLC